jgi:hypothetical protein
VGPHVGGYGNCAGPKSIRVTGATNSGFERNYIETAYSQIPNLSVEGTNEQVTAWSVAKHTHHGPDFGMNPSNYGMSQSDLDSIAKNGLINHINQGGKAPTAKYIKELQMRWKLFTKYKKVTRLDNQTVLGRNCVVIKHIESGRFISFETSTGGLSVN